MSPEIQYCFDDEDIEQVADKMAQLQVRRLPVLNRDKRMVGIISVGDIWRRGALFDVRPIAHFEVVPGSRSRVL